MQVHSHLLWRAGALVAAAGIGLCVLAAGCDQTTPTPLESAGLDHEYLSVDDADTCLVLALADDGRFFVTQRERDCTEDRTMRPDPEAIASGSWSLAEGMLNLEGDGWTVRFEPDSTRVEIPRRAGRLSSLRWVRSTEGSPFSACDLVSSSEFRELLHPKEGSGSSSGL